MHSGQAPQPQAAYPPHVMAEAAHADVPPIVAPRIILPPARRARRIAAAISIVAVAFALGFGFVGRRAYAMDESSPDDAILWAIGALVLLLIAMLLRMGAAVCELLWLERTWSTCRSISARSAPSTR